MRNVDFFIKAKVFEIICTNLDFANVEVALGSQKRHAYLANYASSNRTLIQMEHNVVATIEESCDDTSSYVFVYTNKNQSPMDEPEWRTAQPSISHKKRMCVKESICPKVTNLAPHGDLPMTTSSNASLTQCNMEHLNKLAKEHCQISATCIGQTHNRLSKGCNYITRTPAPKKFS